MEDKNDLVVVKEKIKGMAKMVEETKVTNDAEYNELADKINMVKKLGKWLKQEMEKTTVPAKAIIDEAKSKYDPAIKECKRAEDELKDKGLVYWQEKEAERRRKEEEIARKLEEGKIKQTTAEKRMEKLPEVAKTTITDNGSKLGVTKRRVAKIENPALVPDEYWIIDEVKLRRDALSRDNLGMTQIPGVVIVEEASMRG